MSSASDLEDEKMLREIYPAFDVLEERLDQGIEIIRLGFPEGAAFSVLFDRLFLADQPNYQMPDGSYGASRSNWTYHTALAMAQAAKLMKWSCRFETFGKRDAVLETLDEPPEVTFICEWEWDAADVFGNGKELEKLKHSCRTHKTADAFLLTYCTGEYYPEFLTKVIAYWAGDPSRGRRRHDPTLYLHTIVYCERGSWREFERLRTVMIRTAEVTLWPDETFNA